MKRIILDHLKRRALMWIGTGILFFFIQYLTKRSESTFAFVCINFAVITCIGGPVLDLDLLRGSGRVQQTLPVSARQIGRAWWVLSVALPTLFLALISGLAMVIHSSNTNKGFPLGGLTATALTYALCFGSLFYLIGGTPPLQNAILIVRRVLAIGFVIGIIFIKQPFDTPQGIVFLLAMATMSVLGWYRAEGKVRERGGFRMGVVTGTRKPCQHQAPVGFGGLPLLWRNLGLQLGGAGLVIAAVFLIGELWIPNLRLSSLNPLLEMHMPVLVTCCYRFVIPIIPQMRHLRTMPISTARLAATLVLMPVAPALSVGLAWAAVSSKGIQYPAELVMCAACTSFGVPTILWRGLKWETSLLFVFFMIASALVPTFYHLLKMPFLATTLGSLCLIALSYKLTRRHLQSSSRVYRIPPAMFNAWGGGGR